jgi:NAD(P)-dependent dehydrogenase (short-subunit alcohol dehydrogenase family)
MARSAKTQSSQSNWGAENWLSTAGVHLDFVAGHDEPEVGRDRVPVGVGVGVDLVVRGRYVGRPYLAPCFAAKAAADALAVSYAAELARFGIETTIVVPGAFTSGTNHFAHAGQPTEQTLIPAYDERYPGLMEQVGRRLAELTQPGADASLVADAVIRVVYTRTASVRSAYTSTRPTTAPRKSARSPTGSAPDS